MISQKLKKIKKYLFLISVAVFAVTLFHLIYVYLYDNAIIKPVKWWTVTEWLVWNFPSLNPIKNLSWNNQYVIWLLYRSLLRYDLEQWKIVWDIANCDISSLANIECYINETAKWSNWEKITAEDVYETYHLIRATNSNIILTSLLEDTIIEYKDDIIKFKNNKQDVNFLNVFFQPILAKSVIDNLSDESIFWNFPTTWWVYSWNFRISNVSSDTTIWVSKIVLEKNEHYNKWNISKVTLNIFPDVNSFLKNKDSINIFNDNDNIVWSSMPRLASYRYILPQYIWLFINQNKVQNSDLRTFILNKINNTNLVDLLWKENFVTVNNPYLTETEINKEPHTKNFESIMNSLWYKKKSQLINNITNTWATIEDSNTDDKDILEDDFSIDDFQKDSSIIIKPSYVEKYNFVTKDDILLEWKVDEWTQEVWINEYKLSWYKAWDKTFFYRLKTSYDSIKEWLNSYKIYFVINWEKVFKEEIFFMYYKNQNTLDEEKAKLEKTLYEEYKSTKVEVISNRPWITLWEEEEKELEKLNKLDENIYYDKNWMPFTLKLYYSNTDKNIDTTANFILNSLKELWIEVELYPFELANVAKILSNKDEYDMILTWVNLWYFEFNIFPYFHSSQASAWYNFTNIKRTSLDLLLEELKSNIVHDEKVKELEEKVLDILKEEQVVKTLYTPKINLLVDKNLKVWKVYEKIPSKYLRSYILDSSYTKDEKEIDFANKSIFWFFSFIFKKLYE